MPTFRLSVRRAAGLVPAALALVLSTAATAVAAPTYAGGDTVYHGASRCVIGFNVTGGGSYYFLTAGHCGGAGTVWTSAPSGGVVVGTTQAASFPSNDYALVKYDPGIGHPGSVHAGGAYSDIASAGSPAVGQTVTMTGPVGGVRTGRVTALNATINYAEGTITGLIRTNICVYAGESGSPLFARTVALGLLSGGSGTPSSGCVSYFQPVVEILSAYGVSVY